MFFLDHGWFVLGFFTTLLLPASPPLVLGSIYLSIEAKEKSRSLAFRADRLVAEVSQKAIELVEVAMAV